MRSRSWILDPTAAHPAVQIEKSRGNVESAGPCRVRVRLQRPEAHRATAVSASNRANGEEKSILVPGVTPPLTNFFRSDLHSHMVCKATCKISWEKS